MSGSSRMTPSGWRVLAVAPEVPDSSANFFQRSSHMSSASVMSIFAAMISYT